MSKCKTAKGRLKKGWRFAKGGRCVKAKHAGSAKHKKHWKYVNGAKFAYVWGGKATGRGSNMCFRTSRKTGKKRLVPGRMCARSFASGSLPN